MLFKCIGYLLNMTAHFLNTTVTSSLLHPIITFCPPNKHRIVMTHHVTLSSTITRVKHSWIISTHQKGYKIFRQLWIEQGLSKGLDTHTSVITQIRGSVKTENLVRREKKKLWIAYAAHLLRRSWKVWNFGIVYAEVFVDQNKNGRWERFVTFLEAWSHSWSMVNTGLISLRFNSAHQIEQKWAYGNKMKELVKVVSKRAHMWILSQVWGRHL